MLGASAHRKVAARGAHNAEVQINARVFAKVVVSYDLLLDTTQSFMLNHLLGRLLKGKVQHVGRLRPQAKELRAYLADRATAESPSV